MKKLLKLLVISCLVFGCRKGEDSLSYKEYAESGSVKDTTTYPLFIDGRTKVVYKFGRMTADKGLKHYLDTVSYDVWVSKKDSLLKVVEGN